MGEFAIENNLKLIDKTIAYLTSEELISEINASLKNPEIRLEAQKELLKLQISYPLKDTGKRIATTINECIKETT